jgi:probable O-glycosylation ligase (exosortase A-associated)
MHTLRYAGVGTVAEKSGTSRFGFVLVVLGLILEYARPQDRLEIIGAIHPNWILTSLMVIALLGSGQLSRAASPQIFRMLLLLALLCLHVPFAVNNGRAFYTTLGMFLMLPLVLSIVIFVDSSERLRTMMNWWTFIAFYAALNGIAGGGIAGSSFLNDENDFSLLMSMMLPFPLCLFAHEPKKWMKLAYLSTSFLCVLSIVASASRGGAVALLAVLAVVWLASPRKMLFLVLVGILSVGVYLAADQKYWDRMATTTDTAEGTARERIESWKAGWEMFKDHPLGVGSGNFAVRFPEYQSDYMTRSMWGRQAHSLWFTLLSELGIPGVLLYLSLLGWNVRDLLRLRRLSRDEPVHGYAHYMSVAFIASLVGYLTAGTFLSVLYYPHYWYLTAMIIATRRIVERVADSKPALGLGVKAVQS